MGRVDIHHISKRFDEVEVLHDVSLSIPNGSILALLGPSGSGKTTLLRLLAGFETPDTGRVEVDGEDITRASPAARRFGMVFQHYALFPHMTVAQNVAFGLASQGMPKSDMPARVDEVLALVDLAGYGDRAITALSGGQQQRVALARALAPEPRVLLLDEPLSNLDPSLRERTRRELRDRLKQLGMTSVFVTHEQEEAFDLGDAVAVIHDGYLQQLATPDELYEQPATRFVANFVGRANELSGEVVRHLDAEGHFVAAVHGAEWDAVMLHGAPEVGTPVTVIVRPERLRIGAPEVGLRGTITSRRYTGAFAFFRVETEAGPVLEVLAPPKAAAVGDRIGLMPDGPARAFL